MKANQAEHSISMMARVLKLSRSGYYAWNDRPESKRAHENRLLTQHIFRAGLDLVKSKLIYIEVIRTNKTYW